MEFEKFGKLVSEFIKGRGFSFFELRQVEEILEIAQECHIIDKIENKSDEEYEIGQEIWVFIEK